uniref:Uncharacterized protein n=1 Tax=Romanomermis culicivorax TaxID=13658 RepID=A0A915L7M9_ROMCU
MTRERCITPTIHYEEKFLIDHATTQQSLHDALQRGQEIVVIMNRLNSEQQTGFHIEIIFRQLNRKKRRHILLQLSMIDRDLNAIWFAKKLDKLEFKNCASNQEFGFFSWAQAPKMTKKSLVKKEKDEK